MQQAHEGLVQGAMAQPAQQQQQDDAEMEDADLRAGQYMRHLLGLFC